MKNTLWYLGFLSAAAVLYPVTGNSLFLLFLTFLPYFGIIALDDERVERNIGRATRNAFLFIVIFGVTTIVAAALLNDETLFAPAFVALVGGSLLACLLSLLYYERAGS